MPAVSAVEVYTSTKPRYMRVPSNIFDFNCIRNRESVNIKLEIQEGDRSWQHFQLLLLTPPPHPPQRTCPLLPAFVGFQFSLTSWHSLFLKIKLHNPIKNCYLNHSSNFYLVNFFQFFFKFFILIHVRWPTKTWEIAQLLLNYTKTWKQ